MPKPCQRFFMHIIIFSCKLFLRKIFFENGIKILHNSTTTPFPIRIALNWCGLETLITLSNEKLKHSCSIIITLNSV